MATTYAVPYNGYSSQPYDLPSPSEGYGGKLVVYLASITFASQASGDIVKLFKLPKGKLPLFGFLNVSATTGSATVAIGITGTTGKYRAAATRTTANAPEFFGVVSGLGTTPLSADEEVIATVGTAALPSSGTMLIGMVVSTH